MLYQILKSKIHRATVTDANVDYEGSITLDGELMEAGGFITNEMVHIWDVTSGDRLYTYVMPPAERGSGTVCINGSAALRIKKGHTIIITSFVNLTPEEVNRHKPTKVLVDKQNKIQAIKKE
ncbi:MAG: aspartate 1-decarboxylase [Deltaproteobacteria bacterium RIFCSPLOWO2_12_FULL_40_28]|nr:MAG: aspartate 1-decarboxylase [Deltaproteobacteria bacterium RIFCSPHIGHO2_02_FULL_40_28]OGQ20439.1 MAG: aspartate 1-decarboxylase [Deltaproteobacteria bacterium RIFCSPHIGHO2_12_FULL_40_32]OGQ41408.1 MAG: aspartate 1-decarboxylase [Deltaproteobacteria bacterium RIFCSPLOWO2_02_FULL_40_36]OGQ55047.1 MAG: aspartate 1-decarboxylase [Deltaproteobacteria bacterium RIFCSPLOWO2_12_FULL_40_28]